MMKKTYQNNILLLLALIQMQMQNTLAFSGPASQSLAFQVGTSSTSSNTALFMGAFNKRNKQADLQKKMALAKQQKQSQNQDKEGGDTSDSSASAADSKLSADEIKERNDRKRFEELLNSESATHMSELGGGSYLTSQQEEEEIDASCKFCFRLD